MEATDLSTVSDLVEYAKKHNLLKQQQLGDLADEDHVGVLVMLDGRLLNADNEFESITGFESDIIKLDDVAPEVEALRSTLADIVAKRKEKLKTPNASGRLGAAVIAALDVLPGESLLCERLWGVLSRADWSFSDNNFKGERILHLIWNVFGCVHGSMKRDKPIT
jgi:hypothetical protein